jgi:hypothetical protein
MFMQQCPKDKNMLELLISPRTMPCGDDEINQQ